VWQAELPLCPERLSGTRPSYSLTHASAGKTITQVIPQGPAVDRTRAQIAEYRRFRKLVQELIAVSEQLCNAQLQQPEAMVAEESKKNLFAELLAAAVVQEIETLLGRQAVEDLDLEALELAVRQKVLQRAGAAVEQRLTPTPATREARELVVLVGRKRAWSDAEASRCRAFSVPCNSSAPTIIALHGATASALAMSIWA